MKRSIWKCDLCGQWGNDLSIAASAASYFIHRKKCPPRPTLWELVSGMPPAPEAWWETLRNILPPRPPGKARDIFDVGALPGGGGVMSLVRLGEDSDVYVYEGFDRKLHCCWCSIAKSKNASDERVLGAHGMLVHLAHHASKGDKVPARCWRRLMPYLAGRWTDG